MVPRSIQLVAGGTSQDYNVRKHRKGIFWEDRYHDTAVENVEYLRQCLIYRDLDIVLSGAVEHPSEWNFSGCREFKSPSGYLST